MFCNLSRKKLIINFWCLFEMIFHKQCINLFVSDLVLKLVLVYGWFIEHNFVPYKNSKCKTYRKITLHRKRHTSVIATSKCVHQIIRLSILKRHCNIANSRMSPTYVNNLLLYGVMKYMLKSDFSKIILTDYSYFSNQ